MQSTATPESNKFTIRPAQPADYDTLSELFSITFRSLESIVTYEFRETTEADLRAWIKATRLGGDTQARVAVDEKGKICGFMTFSKASSEIATQCGSLPKGTNEKLRRFRVGAMNGGRNRVFEMIGPFYALDILGVHPDYHGQGIGSQLLRVLTDLALGENKAIVFQSPKPEYYRHFASKNSCTITEPFTCTVPIVGDGRDWTQYCMILEPHAPVMTLPPSGDDNVVDLPVRTIAMTHPKVEILKPSATNHKFTIRRAQQPDFEHLVELFSLAWRSHPTMIKYQFEKCSETDFRSWVKQYIMDELAEERGGTITWVAVDEEGNVCGYATLEKMSNFSISTFGSTSAVGDVPLGTNRYLRGMYKAVMKGGFNGISKAFGEYYHMDMLGVHPKYQGQGVGSQLLQVLAKHAAAEGRVIGFETGKPGFYEKWAAINQMTLARELACSFPIETEKGKIDWTQHCMVLNPVPKKV